MSDADFVTYEEALSELGVSNDEMKRMIQQGELSAYRTKGKMKFKTDDIQKIRGEGSSIAPAPTLVMGSSSESLDADSLIFDDDDSSVGAGDLGGDINIDVAGDDLNLDLGDDSSSQDLVFDFDDASSIEFLDSSDNVSGAGALSGDIPTIQFESSDGSDPLGGSSSDILPTADLNFEDVSEGETINFDTNIGGDSGTLALDDMSDSSGFAPTVQLDASDSGEGATMALDDVMEEQTEALSLDDSDESFTATIDGDLGPTIEAEAGMEDTSSSQVRSRPSLRSQRLAGVEEVSVEPPVHVAWAIVAIFCFLVMTAGIIIEFAYLTNQSNPIVESIVEMIEGDPNKPDEVRKQFPGKDNHIDKNGKDKTPPETSAQ